MTDEQKGQDLPQTTDPQTQAEKNSPIEDYKQTMEEMGCNIVPT